MAVGTAAAIAGGAALGGIGGAIKNKSTSSVLLPQATRQELETRDIIFGGGGTGPGAFGDLRSALQAGPGISDISASVEGTRDLAAIIGQQKQRGFLPTAQDLDLTRGLGQTLFAPQRQVLAQAFQRQEEQFGRQAARLGREITDPILRAKLARQQTEAETALAAQERQFSTDLALRLPQQRISLARQRAQVLETLSNRAIANRQALVGVGSQLLGQERQFRLAQGQREQTSGGGFGGFLSGALGGAGAGLSTVSMLEVLGSNSLNGG